MFSVPDRVFNLNELGSDEAKQLALNMSMDNTSDDRWWESVELTKLFLNSNCISALPTDIARLPCLQILDVSKMQKSVINNNIT